MAGGYLSQITGKSGDECRIKVYRISKMAFYPGVIRTLAGIGNKTNFKLWITDHTIKGDSKREGEEVDSA
jgi:hypothetical protein